MTTRRNPQSACTGFTLAELLLALAIGMFVIAGAVTTYLFSVKGFRQLSNYNTFEAKGRRAVDWFSRDIRIGMVVSSCSSNQIVVILPKTVTAAGAVTATNVVTHALQGGMWSRTDGTGAVKQLATDVSALTFSLYDKVGNVTTQAAQAVSVQVNVVLNQTVLDKTQTSNFLSPKYRMRNSP